MTLYSGKVELGTGALTAITQIAAEELSVPLDRVTTIQGDTAAHAQPGADLRQPVDPGRRHADPARGGDRARGACSTRLHDKLGVAKDDLVVRDGVVSIATAAASCSYAATGRRANSLTIKVDPAAPLKDPKDYTIVGTSVPRLDIPGQDLRDLQLRAGRKLPGMLHARVVHPAGVALDAPKLRRRRLPQDQGLRPRGAQGRFPGRGGDQRMGRDQRLESDRRQVVGLGRTCPRSRSFSSTCAARRSTATRCCRRPATRPQALKAGGRTLQATYDLAMNTHGSIGPSCAVADFKDGRLTVWTPSQASHLLRLQLATMLQLKPENVRCIYVEGAGCYGRNGSDDCSSEAAVDRQGNRQAGATAMDAAGRARLGSEGPSGAARLSRQHR